MKFNEYVKEKRLKRYKHLDKFAKLLGVEKTMWRKIERGINPPPRRSLLKKFAQLTNMFMYEESQMYELAKRWEPSPDTYTTNHLLLSKNSKLDWRDALLKENTPDYPNNKFKFKNL